MKNENLIMSSPVQSSPVQYCAQKFLITGANFGNKGAQSMLFVTTDELRRRFPSCSVYFDTAENYPEENYSFTKFHGSARVWRASAGGFGGIKAFCGGVVRDAVKLLIGRRNHFLPDYLTFTKTIASLSAVIDISGFALSSKWGNHVPEYYLRRIRTARRYNIPVYLMPQSFGPFDYSPDVMAKAQPAISETLKYARVIFAREQEGFGYMRSLFGLDNVHLSSDLVLQNKGVDPANIFTVPPAVSVPDVAEGRETAGIVPNMRCFDHGSKPLILEAYTRIIRHILGLGYSVVLFRHSFEDIEACRELKAIFPDEKDVILVENDFSCIEYNEFVKQFKFLVCSRYHGLVHAYKNNVPCVALGWAVKYRSLTEILGQSGYMFDITAASIDIEGILTAISHLLENYDSERRTIREKLADIQANNCFDIVEEDLRAAGAVK